MMLFKTTHPRVTVTAIALFSCSWFSSAAQAQMEGMAEQLARLGGAMHATEEICGNSSEATLIAAKQKQQEMLAQQGMEEKKFDKVYSSALKETRSEWKRLSDSEQQAACDDFKKRMASMVPKGMEESN